MGTILQTIAEHSRLRVIKDRQYLPLDTLKAICTENSKADGKSFEDALRKPGISFICEVKKASPSKGIISEDFPYLNIAQEYVHAGADCISCLTEPKWFLGSDDIFKEIRDKVSIPMLRKDFVVDEYQIYQARYMGANAVLLICAILDTETVAKYLELCERLGITAIVETHDENEIKKAVAAGARIIGVNNRNLKDFSVNFENCKKLRSHVPDDVIFIAESGIRTADDIEALRKEKVDAVLIGETLMRAQDKRKMLESLRNGA
ncbi:MAG: indole-3-glycerol phosphate synthase TrpC [Acetivibrionales bacterium]|jgi:indole-3-glycerol phosphate synthase|nr:indole-3-glycerol phosphate synthase TrpC [Clostridiaceae bacterium]